MSILRDLPTPTDFIPTWQGDGRQLPALELVPANHGGFVVMAGADLGRRSDARSYDFAGDLDACLGYMRRRMTETPA